MEGEKGGEEQEYNGTHPHVFLISPSQSQPLNSDIEKTSSPCCECDDVRILVITRLSAETPDFNDVLVSEPEAEAIGLEVLPRMQQRR